MYSAIRNLVFGLGLALSTPAYSQEPMSPENVRGQLSDLAQAVLKYSPKKVGRVKGGKKYTLKKFPHRDRHHKKTGEMNPLKLTKIVYIDIKPRGLSNGDSIEYTISRQELFPHEEPMRFRDTILKNGSHNPEEYHSLGWKQNAHPSFKRDRAFQDIMRSVAVTNLNVEKELRAKKRRKKARKRR